MNPADNSQFIATSYPAIKEARPDLKVLIREASGIEPRAFARFGELCSGWGMSTYGTLSKRQRGAVR